MTRAILKPFGPSILKTSIPQNIIEALNLHIDNIVNSTKKSKELDFGQSLAGNVQQEFKLEPEFIKKSGWGKHLMEETKIWIEQLNKNPINNMSMCLVDNFKILETWIVRQFENEYNPAHYHLGHISGVGYLKIPDDLGPTVQQNKVNQNGHLHLMHGSKQFLSNVVLDVKPKVGDLYLFPAYLVHTVYPFKNKKLERRSISFNALINEETFNN